MQLLDLLAYACDPDRVCSFYIEDMLTYNVKLLAMIFFLLIFLVATQDIAVDGRYYGAATLLTRL
jgi:hypothetical protein